MNEENMPLLSYSDLADKIKTLKIENNVLKDKIKASKRQKVLLQRHDKFTWKKNKTDTNMRFCTGIASVALFNTTFTLIKLYIQNITYQKAATRAMRTLNRTRRKKMPASLNSHDEFLITLMQLRLELLNEDVVDRFDISPTKSSFIFTTWISC